MQAPKDESIIYEEDEEIEEEEDHGDTEVIEEVIQEDFPDDIIEYDEEEPEEVVEDNIEDDMFEVVNVELKEGPGTDKKHNTYLNAYANHIEIQVK